MKTIAQILNLVTLGLTRSLHSRASVLSIVFCIGCAVSILIVMFSMSTGLRSATLKNVRDDRVFVMSEGSRTLSLSALPRDRLGAIEGTAGVLSHAQISVSSPIVSVMVEAKRVRDGGRISVPLIGVGRSYQSVYPELRLTRGRLFRPGVHEIVVGKAAVRRVAGLNVGETIRLREIDWLVVGEFEQNGGSGEQALVTDVETLMSAFRIRAFNAVVLLADPEQGGFSALKAGLEGNPAMHVNVRTESQVLNDEVRSVSGPLNFVSSVVVVFTLLGAALAAVNAMFSIIDSRRTELATLRALGFGDGRILIAVIIETTMLVIPGAVAGSLIAYFVCSDSNVELLGRGIPLLVTPSLMAGGVIAALCVGLLGGVFPAVRAVRLSVINALRER